MVGMAGGIIGFLESPLTALAITLFLGVLAVSGKFSQHAAQLLLLGMWFVGILAIGCSEMRDPRLLIGAVLAFTGFCLLLSYWIKPPEQGSPKATVKTEDAPTLLAQYTPRFLPIQIPAQSSVFVLPLNPSIGEHTDEIRNLTQVPTWWPEKPRAKDEFPLGPMYECRLSNYGTKALLDLSIVFELSFLSVKPMKVSMHRDPDGTFTITGEQPEADQAVFAQALPTLKPLGGKTGEVISKHAHIVTIPAIPAQGSVSLYLVAQTKLFSRFVFPQTATAIIEGNPIKRLAVLVRPAMSPVDTVKFWTLQPSIYEWPSVKDPIFEEAIPWAKKGKSESMARKVNP